MSRIGTKQGDRPDRAHDGDDRHDTHDEPRLPPRRRSADARPGLVAGRLGGPSWVAPHPVARSPCRPGGPEPGVPEFGGLELGGRVIGVRCPSRRRSAAARAVEPEGAAAGGRCAGAAVHHGASRRRSVGVRASRRRYRTPRCRCRRRRGRLRSGRLGRRSRRGVGLGGGRRSIRPAPGLGPESARVVVIPPAGVASTVTVQRMGATVVGVRSVVSCSAGDSGATSKSCVSSPRRYSTGVTHSSVPRPMPRMPMRPLRTASSMPRPWARAV